MRRINIRVLDSNPNLRRAELIDSIKFDLNKDQYLKSEPLLLQEFYFYIQYASEFI